jgi:hypothetical protein
MPARWIAKRLIDQSAHHSRHLFINRRAGVVIEIDRSLVRTLLGSNDILVAIHLWFSRLASGLCPVFIPGNLSNLWINPTSSTDYADYSDKTRNQKHKPDLFEESRTELKLPASSAM